MKYIQVMIIHKKFKFSNMVQTLGTGSDRVSHEPRWLEDFFIYKALILRRLKSTHANAYASWATQ